MTADIRTMMWKEWKLLFRHSSSRWRSVVVMLTIFAMAIINALMAGPEYPHDFMAVLLAFVIPLVTVGVTIPDSFAGERERHTLETLLASRLPDRAILFGKLLVSVSLGWLVTIVVLLVSLLVVNVAYWQGTVLFFTPTVTVACLILSLLVALLCAGVGVLVSLRMDTAQGASQLTVTMLMLPMMVLGMVFFLTTDTLIPALEQAGPGPVLTVVAAALLLADVILLSLATWRFQRARLLD